MSDKYSIYTGEPHKLKRPCQAPYRYVFIDTYGNVVLCCNDWKSMVTFGSLKEKPVREIFLSDRMMNMYLNLIVGNREKCFLCSRCYRHK